MLLALSIPANRRGACPSLDAPMQTGDGLLVRLRIAEGRMTPDQLAAIAALAAEHGNGLIEITARGNLQVRGLTATSAGPFARAVEIVIGIERGLVVETPPLAGEDPSELADPRPLADAIRAAAGSLGARLGPKVTVIVDGNGRLSLAALKADIRLLALEGGRWSLGLGASKPQVIDADAALATTIAVLSALAALGPDARATDLFPPRDAAGDIAADGVRRGIGTFPMRSGEARGIALPFGSSDHVALANLAALAIRLGIAEFRLAPHHCLLAIGAPPAFTAGAAALGFVVSTDDPRIRISACIGSDGCASGHIPARAVGARLAGLRRAEGHLHVAGCTKGCAHPRRAALTLVGRPDGYGLVIDGTAGDTPVTVLRADQLESALGSAAQG